MAALHATALRSCTGQGPWRQAKGSDTDALRGDPERQATFGAMHGTRSTWACGARGGTDVEELLHMKRLLAEKLEEHRPPCEQHKPIPGMLLSKAAQRTPSSIEEASWCSRSSSSPRSITPSNIEEVSWCSRSSSSPGSLSSSPHRAQWPVARVLLKDCLAYVVR